MKEGLDFAAPASLCTPQASQDGREGGEACFARFSLRRQTEEKEFLVLCYSTKAL